MATKLSNGNLYDLKNNYRTETPHYFYMVKPIGINLMQLIRKAKETGEEKIVRMPECYRGYFKKWKWE